MRPTDALTQEDRARLDAATDWMVRLEADDLPEDQLAEWLAWYDDPANRMAFDEMQAVREELSAIDAGARRDFAQPFVKAEQRRSWLDIAREWFMPWGAVALAGLAALAIGVGVWPGTWFASPVISTAYQTGRGDHREINLPDGSVVKLGALSSLSMNFTRETRYLVLEAGEALFQVHRDPGRPFVVQAGSLRVRAIGTEFNIRRADENTFVSVREGVVEVTQERMPPKRTTGETVPPLRVVEVVQVPIGKQALATQADIPLRITTIAPETVATWLEGRLEFVDEPLRSVVATVNRYSTREIVLTDPAALGELRFTGIVREGGVEEWVHAIQDVFPLKATVVGKGAILLHPTS